MGSKLLPGWRGGVAVLAAVLVLGLSVWGPWPGGGAGVPAAAATTPPVTASPTAQPTPPSGPLPSPSPTPMPSSSPSPAASASPAPSASPKPSASPSPAPSASPSAGPAAKASPAPRPSPTPGAAGAGTPPRLSPSPAPPAPTLPPFSTLPASSKPVTPLSPQQQSLATSLTQADSQLNELRAEAAQTQQQQAQLQAQVGADQAQVQQLNQQIGQLQTRVGQLTTQEKQEKAQLADLARAIYAEPSSTLLSVLESANLGDYLTQNATLEGAAQRAHQITGQLDVTRRQAQAAQVSLTQKRDEVTADEQQAQASQVRLESLATQLQSQQAQVNGQTSTTESQLALAQEAALQQGGSVTSQEAATLVELGTGGLDEKLLDAGLASGLYTLSTSKVPWPALPDPSPLGLAGYLGYCDYTPIQCTCYAANAYQAYTGGVLPQNLGNAAQWISGAQAAGIPTSETPVEGAIVAFAGPSYSSFGHVAIVRSVILAGGAPIGLVVWERNMDEAGTFDARVVALGSDSQILGYIPPAA